MNRLNKIAILQQGNNKYFKAVKYPNPPLNVNDIYIVAKMGDRLDLLANHYYKDSTLWWIISSANPGVVRRDSFYIRPGVQIRIPAGKDELVQLFEEFNKE
jgi:hypothetical protein